MTLDSKKVPLQQVDPENQLELLNLQCKNISPKIYRAYALYLQVLRSTITEAVHNSIIFLISEQGHSALSFIPDKTSCEFQENIDKLISTCSSLLTVEHLIELAAQIDKDNRIKIEATKTQILSALNNDKSSSVGPFNKHSLEESVNISYAPPIDNPSQINSWFQYNQSEDDELMSEDLYESNSSKQLPNDFSELSSHEDIDLELPHGNKKNNGKDLLGSIFAMASQVFDSKLSSESQSLEKDSKPLADLEPLSNTIQKGLIPEDPSILSEWISTLEEALARRLRNLSHAINVELLRVGIVNSIVPLSLLDAVLEGQMNTQYSNSNILKLNVASTSPSYAEPIEISCLLIRLSELEFDDLRLRHCRSSLKDYHKKIFKMVRQQRYWQGRSIASQIHQNWWPNTTEASPVNPPEN